MTNHSGPVLRIAAKAAVINEKGEILIIREAATGADTVKVGQWGLPGGRLNLGEPFLEGLKREVMEETGLTVGVEADRPLYVGEWHPVIRGVEHQIIAIFMACTAAEAGVTLSDEHDSYLWINPRDRSNYPMMEPDCFVVDVVANTSN